jgi:Cu/Ag efflux protein CusF
MKLSRVVFGSVLAGLVALSAGQGRAEEGHAKGEEAKGAAQTKTGIVRKVDADAKQIVVMVARELTFTVNDATKITQGDAARKLTDIKVDDKVSVTYTRKEDVRTATVILILPKGDEPEGKKKAEGAEQK